MKIEYCMINKSIDIILPIYKPNESVFNAIDSVLNQTYTNWTLHIIDDNSKDASLQIIKQKYSNKKGVITYYKLSENKRAAYARNFIAGKCKGDYIAFLDQDDIWLPKKLGNQIRLINETSAKACHTNISFINVDDNCINIKQAEKENTFRNSINWDSISPIELTKTLFSGTHIRLVSAMVSRKAFIDIGGFDSTLFGGEDWEFWVRFANKYRIAHVPEDLIMRRISNNNTSKVYQYRRQVSKLRALGIIESKKYFNNKRLVDRQKYQICKSIIISSNKHDKAEMTRIVYRHLRSNPLRIIYNFKLVGHLLSKLINLK